MIPLMQTLHSELVLAFRKAFPDFEGPIEVTRSTQAQFGHYQCNSAMRLAKPLKLAPRQISEQVVKNLESMEGLERAEIAGPGFINLWLSNSFLSTYCQQMLELPKLGLSLENKTKVVIDFSSPNIAKQMHVGHLRSTIIGDCLARVFEYLGHDTLRLNHLGDWGTAFGMLIAYIKRIKQESIETLQYIELEELVAWYKEAKQLFDHDVDFKKLSQLEVVQLQSGEEQSLHVWQLICKISEKAYQEIYDLLGVTLISRGESFYNPMLQQTVERLESKGLVSISHGAKCVYLDGYSNREGEPLPMMIQKSDGGFNYSTTDLAAIVHRADVEKGQRLVYVTDAGQATHFEMLFKLARQAQLIGDKVRCDHVPFGLVLGPDGKKFKTRSGETERLIDLLQAAVLGAKERIESRNLERGEAFTVDEITHMARVIGVGAVKYADLSCNRIHDYVFSYDRMLKFEGNTAAFLLYSYVRICGIKRKIKSLPDLDSVTIELELPAETALGLHLAQWSDMIHTVSEELSPNRICEYLFELANAFNAFFRDCRVEGDAKQNERLRLCDLTARVLEQGLTLLGLETLERM